MLFAKRLTLVLLILRDIAASFLRVESGHQQILIDGRDPYMGFFTRLHFHQLTCIRSLTIHCLKPLTGAEEIDILYSECEHNHWKVVHYANTKEKFVLKWEVVAQQLSISSRVLLSIIDVQVETCTIHNNAKYYFNPCHRPRVHQRQHDISLQSVHAEEVVHPRQKRSTDYVLPAVYRTVASPYDIPFDVVIPENQTVVIEPGVTLRFSKNAGFTVRGVLIVNGTKAAPITFEPQIDQWKGIEIINASLPSRFSFANVSGSSMGITLKSGVPPSIDNVISEWNQYGFDFQTVASVHIVSSAALNNEKDGFRIRTKGDVLLESSVSVSNHRDGFHLNVAGNVTVLDSHSISNGQHGFILLETSSSVLIQQAMTNSNAANGIRFDDLRVGRSLIELTNVHVTDHYHAAGISFQEASDLRLEMNHCFIEENHILGISFDGVTANSSIHIVDSNFTRNRGSTILMSLLRDVDVKLHRNTFIANNLNDFDQHEAVIDIATFAERSDSRIRIEDNHFEQNSMKNVLIVRQLGGYTVQVLIMKNNFVANLAQSIIDLDVPEGEIKGNYFSNVQSTCDITRISLMSADAVENYWAHETDAEYRPRICTLSYESYEIYEEDSTKQKTIQNSSSSRGPVDVIAVGTMRTPRERWAMEQEVVKRISSFNNSSTLRPFSNTYNQVKAIPQPYSIGSEVAIQPGQIVIVDPGSEFEFAPGIGLTVQDKGKLYLNGTVDKPIRLFGESTWRGLIIKPGGTLVMSHTIIKDASIGIWIDSEKVQVESARITDSVVHAVEITGNAGIDIDLGYSVIERAKGTGIGVDERKSSLRIRNIIIRDGWGSGIDFVSPTGDINIENVLVSNGSSYSIHIVEFPAFPLKTVSLRNVTVSGQNRGHAGVLITSGWVEEINIERSLFARNTVPSLIIGVECRQKKSQAYLTNTTFRNNEDIVVHFDVGECVSVSVTGNRFLENNKAIGHGVLMLNAAPKEKFSALPIVVEENEFLRNRGEYAAMLGMHGTSAANGSGWFRGNRLLDNVNSVASVIVTSPYYRIHANEFSNPSSAHDLDVRSNGSWKLEATGNKWHTTDMLKAIKAPEGSVKLKIDEMLTKPDAQLLPYNSQCAHLNYCSHVGNCQGGICLCPANRVGLDCSIAIGCPSNCSNNGVCDIMNRCVCHDGWSSADCSIPLCRYDCHGHGRCVSKNECECYAGWGGEFCDEPGCEAGSCLHGKCVSSKCQCSKGWQGSRCSIPVCRNCSINGRCLAPEKCDCFEGYHGEDCSICQGPRCQSCDFDCAHGVCERETRTCSCARGWSGAACDVCRSANCQVKSSVLYILPSIADREDVNVVVNVFGTEFPQTPSSSYTCIFGASYSEGKRISSTVVRCRVPKQLTLGRHLFNLAPDGSISVIPNFDVRPIHFTIYDSCTPSFCKGVCVGPLCVCPKGATGINCDVFEIVPSIDRHFLEYQKASTATESSPYIVVLPTMPGSLYHVNSTINDLHFDSARGIIEWPQPVGSYTPYMITVVSNSLSGESSVSWNVTVEPSYTVDVISVKNVPGLSTMRIMGKLRGLKNNYAAPVTLWIKRMDQEQLMKIPVKSDGDTFTHDFIPDQGGNYTVAASHPGAPLTSDGVQFEVQPLQLSIDNDSHSTIIRALNDCHVNMLRPRNGTVVIEKMENSVSFVENAPNWRGETVSLLICGNRRELWRNQLNRQVPSLTAVPSVIALPFGSVQSKSFEVIIYRNDVHLDPPLKLASSDSTQPVFVIATDPDINYINSSTKYDHLKLAFGQNSEYREGMNSSLQLVANEKVVVRIPIYYVGATNKFNVSICVKDSYDYAGNGDDTAVLSVSNTALGVDIVRSNMKLNKDFVSFPLTEGFYQITAKAPNHRTVSEVVHITPVNTSFCVNLVAIDTRSLVTVGERGISTVKLKETNMIFFPHIELEPSSVNQSHTRILVTVSGKFSGLLSMNSFENDFLILKPSARSVPVNASFWIGVEWKRSAPSTTAYCDAHIFLLPFVFVADDSHSVQQMSVDVVAQTKTLTVGRTQWKICDDSNRPYPVAYSTRVTCDCAQGARSNCRKKYKSAAACGSAWKRIFDDTVSLQVLSTFFLLLTDCRTVHVNLTELGEAMQCVSSLESECPILRHRKRSIDNRHKDLKSYTPVDVINHISTVNKKITGVFNPVLPSLNALDMRSIRMATLYLEFIERLQKIFPPSIIDCLDVNGGVIDEFLRSISDNSELGIAISTTEAEKLKDDNLVQLWNATVTEWTSGRMESPGENVGILYADAKQLVVTADRLQSLTRQNGAPDPFSMLHEYVGQILTTRDNRDEECMSAAVLVEPYVIYEDSTLTIDVFIESLQDSTLTNIDLSIDFVRNDMFVPPISFGVGPSWSAGINTISGFGVLAPRSSFEVHWSRKIITENRLTATAFYQAVIVIGFHKDGLPSKQRLKSPLLEIRPRRSVRLLHFVNGDVSRSPTTPFSAMTAIMNIGYSPLANVRVLHVDFDLVTSSRAAPFEIVQMDVDGKRIASSLSPVVGNIESGTSKRITYHITTPGQAAKIANMSVILTVDGQLTAVEDEHVYVVKVAASKNDGFIVSSLTDPEPTFFYRPDIGSIVNIVPLQYVTSTVKSKSDDERKITILASFRNLLSPGLTGALWCGFKLPPIPANYRLTRVADQRGARSRVLTPVTWTEEQMDGTKLNFIDSGASFPVSDIVYEMEFTEPSQKTAPTFDQTSYRAQIFPSSWPQPGYPFAVISAHSLNSSNLTYSLFSPDNEKTFAVDPNTGELFLTSSVPPGDEFCTLLSVKDQEGRVTSVPVAINTGGPRRDCVNFDVIGLSPSIYHGPHRGSLGSWTTDAPTTTSATEETYIPYTEYPGNSPETSTSASPGTAPEGQHLSLSPTSITSPETATTQTTLSSSSLSKSSSETPTTVTMHETLSTYTERSSSLLNTLATDKPTTTTETNEPIHPMPISPDATPVTLTHPTTTLEEVTKTTEILITITPDWNPPPLTTTTTIDGFPIPTAIVIPHVTSRSSETTNGKTTVTVIPDSTLQATSPESTDGHVYTVTQGQSLATITSTEGMSSSDDVISLFSSSSKATTSDMVTTTTPNLSNVTGETTKSINTASSEGTTENVVPTVLPPLTIPTSGTPAPFRTTTKSPKTTLNPYYGVACSKRGEPIWDLICELSKVSIRKNV